jgi:hypothetical protein
MKMHWVLILVASLAACERSTPDRSTNEGKPAQSAAGATSDEGKAIRSATGR